MVTNNHPEELVSADNAKKFQIGYSGDVVAKDGIFLKAKLVITDSETIKAIKDGKKEISNGYTSNMDFAAGVTPDGENFDVMQTNIKGNHIAIVEKGRCGPSCRVTDSKQTPRKKPMPKITLDSVDYEASEQVVQAVGKLQTSLDTAKDQAVQSKKDLDKVQGQMDQATTDHKSAVDKLQAKLDDADKNKLTPAQLDSMIESRSAILVVANKVIPNFDHVSKDCEQIRKEVVAHVVGDTLNIEEKSAEYIQARFDAIASTKPAATVADAARQHAQSKDDEQHEVVDSEKARADFIDKSRNAWKPASQKTA